MTTGERIKQRRLELGMTQTELAEKTGYSDKSSIAVIESGKNNLRQSKIQAFADALDCDPLWLIGLDEQEPTEPPDYYLNADARAAAEFAALKASESRQNVPAVQLDKIYTSDFESVYKALNAQEKRRLWRSVIREIRMDSDKALDIIFL